MPKTIIEGSRVLPDIDEQIKYIHGLRGTVVKHLKNGLDMILAIEQSLLAAKLNITVGKKGQLNLVIPDDNREELLKLVLSKAGIKSTSGRLEVLQAIMNISSKYFSISDLEAEVLERRYMTRTAILKIVLNMKDSGLVREVSKSDSIRYKRQGRPEKFYEFINLLDMPNTINT